MRGKAWAFNPHSGGKKITPVKNIMTENYYTSWDLIESNKGDLPDDEDAYERKYQEWMGRDWIPWLREHLSFPFQVKQMEDEDDAYLQM